MNRPVPEIPAIERKLSSKEAHDLGMLIKDRTKVLRAHADDQAAQCLADFEAKISATFQFDKEDTWRKLTEEAAEVIKKANEQIAKLALKKYGIPPEFAPGMILSWAERGQNRTGSRREELRRLAKAQIEAMKKKAVTDIERQGLDLRTQIMSLQVLGPDARMFLESLAPVEQAMGSINFAEIEAKMIETESKRRPRLGYNHHGEAD